MLALPATLTVNDAGETVRTLAAGIDGEEGTVVAIDASPLVQLDTAAVAVLIECCRVAQARGRRIELHGVPRRLGDLARLYAVEHLIGIPSASPES